MVNSLLKLQIESVADTEFRGELQGGGAIFANFSQKSHKNGEKKILRLKLSLRSHTLLILAGLRPSPGSANLKMNR